MVRAGMIPQDDDEEDCGGENEGLAGTPHDNVGNSVGDLKPKRPLHVNQVFAHNAI